MDARMKFLEHELEEKERELVKVKREEEPARVAGGVLDERITALERKMRELEAMLKGLMEETLDLKSVTRKIARTIEERDPDAAFPAEEIIQREVRPRSRNFTEGEAPRTRDRRASPPPVAAREPEPEPEPPVDNSDMELIMQQDGTLKPERRIVNDYIVASSGYAPATKMKGGKITSNIYEAPDVDPKSGAVISKNNKDDSRTSETIRRRK